VVRANLENDDGAMGIRFWSSPKTERRCGGGVAKGWTMTSGSSSVVHDGHGGEEKRWYLGAMRLGRSPGTFI
jgi:hypothetical protein